jgi:hypothetical protein
MEFPSDTKRYNAMEVLEGRPIRDDLTALAQKHDLGGRNGGWSAEQVALYLDASLHAMRQISPERWNGHVPRADS